ncbi:hypothetical protein GA0116948_11430 [Chitinophaga costaii]|uniref:Uncharacterized protein n=1 Tax=Chitinophaga costaii TaxID=1335309 RepID=A0A1C4FFY4_9BACT|nr:hypothetical protein [Chitinophaga costaii]PUZ20141.1 hypothetical protein DCM91_19615 [Chitinophaga costaii]SCC54937.1 hypothetical protein GA0116948_11430 [Chitinophaga costaii]
MTKTSIIGIVSAVMVIISAFLPWITVESRHFLFTGLQTTGSAFGQPGILNIILATIAVILFGLNKTWTFRVNIFIAGFLMAWTFRNYLIFSRCEAGECPDQKIGLYLSLIGGILCFVCVVLNRQKPKENKNGL